MYTTFAAMLLASGLAVARPPEQRSQAAEQHSQQPEPQRAKRPSERQAERQPTEDTLDDQAIETGGAEAGIAPDGYVDHLHWSAWTMPQDRFHAEDLINAEVWSRDDELVGQVVDLVLDREGRILTIVVETGAELGLGGRAVAVPWEDAQPMRTGDREFYLLVESDQYSLLNAPEYERE